MTSSESHLKAGQRRWDYSVQQYKEGDPFLERGLFSILVLAHGRPEVTKRCLLSTLDAVSHYDGEVEWIFIENGECNQNLEFFQELPIDRKVIILQRNYGINHGLNQAWALSRGEWCMVHENDWECRSGINFLKITKDILTEQSEVGIVQLRAMRDPNENWGIGKPEYSPWTCHPQQNEAAGISLWHTETKEGHPYWISNLPNGFNNNPCVIRKTLYRECGPYPEAEVGYDPRHGETEYQGRVASTDCVTAHIGADIYYHCGQVSTVAE
jgi:GT2 family glycosyltransferase